MELELAVDPQDAARVFRHDAFAATRGQKAATHRHRVIWHDTPDHALAGAGLVLAEQSGAWRIERLRPVGAMAWPPGAPAAVLSAAPSVAALDPPAPPAAAPVASFEAREARRALMVDGEPVEVTLRRGVLRAVAAERPAARLVLSGPEAAVRALAVTLAAALRIEPPRASLAAEGLALAAGEPPAARRLGAPELPADSGDIRATFQHALGHFADVLLHYAPLAAADTHGPEPVHQMRVAVRRARSTITVFRPALSCAAIDRASAELRGLGAKLGPTRDWDVFVTETLPAVMAAFPAERKLARLAAAAAARRAECHAALRAYLLSPDFRLLGVELAWLAASGDWGDPAPVPPGDGVHAFAAAVLRKRARKLGAAGRRIAQLDIPALHDLRLRAKRARYAAEVFAPLFPHRHGRRFLRRLSAVQQALGVLNDGAVAAGLTAELGGAGGRHGYAVGLVLGFIAARAEALRPGILRSWDKFRRADPFWA